MPTLVLLGRYDPFADPAQILRAVRSELPRAATVVDPAGGHNVLAGDCLRAVRNTWTSTLHDANGPRVVLPPCWHSRRVRFRFTPVSHGPPTALPHGTYHYRLSPGDLRLASRGRFAEQDVTNNAGAWTWLMHRGRWSLHVRSTESATDPTYPCSGTVTVDGDVATFVRTVNGNPEGDCVPPTWSARFAVREGVLRWSAVSIPDFGWVFATKPWNRL
jgi:hypothetical protein